MRCAAKLRRLGAQRQGTESIRGHDAGLARIDYIHLGGAAILEGERGLIASGSCECEPLALSGGANYPHAMVARRTRERIPEVRLRRF